MTNNIDITQKFDAIHSDYPSLGSMMFLNFWCDQEYENECITTKKIIVNDNLLYLSGFEVRKVHKHGK